ncbi:hypothetical protein GIB67_015948 [Kingdonia uniflora]|uniref:Uncharacterized protein n=1 Tax=Kingdonia uniflora TaxID=39325 RepID=A0A7J7PCK2_9MAGN|nr:hypothetical protein GIB67_015948 [Kingdonia uniflora]
MTAELSKKDQINVLEFFKAIALRDGHNAADYKDEGSTFRNAREILYQRGFKTLIVIAIIELEGACIGGGGLFQPARVEKMNEDTQGMVIGSRSFGPKLSHKVTKSIMFDRQTVSVRNESIPNLRMERLFQVDARSSARCGGDIRATWVEVMSVAIFNPIETKDN